MNFSGFGAIVPLDYGYSHGPEHSVLLVSDDWPSLVDLLATPFAYLQNARGKFVFNDESRNFGWDAFGPLTIVLEPLTNPSLASASGLRAIAGGFAVLGDGNPANPNTVRAEILNSAADSWDLHPQPAWRNIVLAACTDPISKKANGFFVVEYALMTRVMVIRYVAPPPNRYRLKQPFYKDKITAVTFSDFMRAFSIQGKPRTAFMHFDLKPPTHTHSSVALCKAQFVVDYITEPIGVLTRLCSPGRLERQLAKHDYHYADPVYAHTFLPTNNVIKLSGTTDAVTEGKFKVFTNKKPRFGRLRRPNQDHDPIVVMESVDPWADGKIWEHVPIANSEGMTLPRKRQAKVAKTGKGGDLPTPQSGDDPSAPYPCVLISITVGGTTQWVIDPASTLVKNYVAPTLNG